MRREVLAQLSSKSCSPSHLEWFEYEMCPHTWSPDVGQPLVGLPGKAFRVLSLTQLPGHSLLPDGESNVTSHSSTPVTTHVHHDRL